MSAERQARMDRWYGLWAELDRSEDYRVRGRLRLFSVSLRTFEANCQELLRALEAIRPKGIPEDLGTPIGDDWIMPQLADICRHLSNYLAAASSLIDHSRVLYREVYQPRGLIAGYQVEVDARFKENGLTRLVNALRNVNLHCHHLIITYSQQVRIDRGGQSISSEVFRPRDKLLAHGDLHSAARAFVESSTDRIGLESLVRRYHQSMLDFHRWFSARQQEIHGEAFARLARIEQELREIKAAEKAHFDGLAASAQSDAPNGGASA
jgi:hypothetical protein